MTLTEMLNDLKSRIGSTPEVTDGILTGWINRALLVFCREQDWSWLEKKVTSSTVADQKTYAVPSDYYRMVELQVGGTDATPAPYTLVPWEQRVLWVSGETKVSLFADELYLFPTPSSVEDIDLAYIRTPTEMSDGSSSPADSNIANMPAAYHEALVLYAFAIYNTYDEEHAEAESVMGSVNSPRPGTYYYYVDLAKRDDSQQKRGERTRMLSKQEFVGYSYPNQTSTTTTVLGN